MCFMCRQLLFLILNVHCPIIQFKFQDLFSVHKGNFSLGFYNFQRNHESVTLQATALGNWRKSSFPRKTCEAPKGFQTHHTFVVKVQDHDHSAIALFGISKQYVYNSYMVCLLLSIWFDRKYSHLRSQFTLCPSFLRKQN